MALAASRWPSALTKELPHESVIYFGDTAHLPYGDKSAAAIQSYAVKICDVLLRHQVKAILIACHSASAVAFDLVKEYTSGRVKVYNVIDPVVQHLQQNYAGQTVGLIGTNRTIGSNIYQKKLDETAVGITLASLATPLLAPMIEAGFYQNTISRQVVEEYLLNPVFKSIQTLVLGCTHYPLIHNDLAAVLPHVTLTDPAQLVAHQIHQDLLATNLTAPKSQRPQHRFFVSDYTRSFEESTRIFFGHKIALTKYPLW